jgi:Bacterial Ig-like domain (group 3)
VVPLALAENEAQLGPLGGHGMEIISKEREEPSVKSAMTQHAHAREKSPVIELGIAALVALAILFACLTASASAEEGTEGQPIPPSALGQLAQGQGTRPSLTDPQAAEQLPHQDLERAEALNLMEAVFGPVLQSAAGPFDDLHVQRFLSDNVAVIAAGDQPAASGATVGESATQAGYDGPTLIESTLPLRVNGDSPADALDLGLERADDELQPTNPLAQVSIPEELGEGIDIPSAGVGVKLVGAPESRAPSIIEQSVAAYPEVEQDTSFVVAPTPAGFETMSVLQSADAPTSQTYHLDLPQGAQLEETLDGGAIVTRDGETLLEVGRPEALDASGAAVPVRLKTSGDAVAVEASPDASSQFPIVVDPTFTYDWFHGASFSDWSSESNNAGLVIGTKALCLSYCPIGWTKPSGVDVFAKSGSKLISGSNGTWSYYVPRYFTDQEQFGAPPQSFVTSMVLQNLIFYNIGRGSTYLPAWVSGIWDQIGNKYTSVLIHGGNEGVASNPSTTYTFGYGGDQNAKRAIAAQLYAGEPVTMSEEEREIYVGTATIEIGDSGKPTFGTPTPSVEGWVNNKATSPITFTVSDAGLGLKSMWVRLAGETEEHKGWTTSISCASTPSSPCPRTWKSGAGQPALEYDPSVLPQGEDTLELTAKDPAGNSSTAAKAKVNVDHTAPTIALSGAMTEQATIGTTRPRYFLKAVSSDGTEGAPQSGVAKTEIKVDGTTVDSTSAGCATKNCSVTRGWTLEASKYSVGKHTVVVTATDAVGLTTEKTQYVELQPDTTKPTIENFGSLYNAPDGWVEQKTYEFGINAWDNGYGVTALEFKMDGAVVKSAKTSCPNGGCMEWLNVAINMSSYKGGAHTAAIVATDGAGNVTTEAWTVNVDPKGEVSAGEAITTLEAVDSTGETQVVVPSVEIVDEGEYEEGNNPGLQQTGSELESTGTGATTVMTTTPSDGVTIESAEGNIEIDPMKGGSSSGEVAAGAVAVSGGTNVDTAVRPIYDGLMTYQSIRDSSAPQEYSWEVSLLEGQTLEVVDSQHAAIFNEDESQALAITAEPSHDATGKAVPTEISVSSNVLTLIVKHVGGGFVYPVVGGPAFQASYVEPIIYTPPPPPPAEEGPNTEEEWNNVLNGQWPLIAKISAPQMTGCPGEGEACASSSGYIKTYGFTECIQYPIVGGCTPAYEQKIRGFFYFNFNEAWMSKRQPNCESSSIATIVVENEYCKWVGPDHQKYGGGYHITSQVKFRLKQQPSGVAGNWKYITVRMFGSGNAYAHQTSAICNPSRPEC